MSSLAAEVSARSVKVPDPQSFHDDSIHSWYKLVFGYSDRAVTHLVNQFEIRKGGLVLDPFCGAGTTVVECKKTGISCLGVDANPSSVLAARVKTNWNLSPRQLRKAVGLVKRRYEELRRDDEALAKDPANMYIVDSGMVKRGWICQAPLREIIALKMAIASVPVSRKTREALNLALVTEAVHGSSNVRFGPELYCGNPRNSASPMPGFIARVEKMAREIEKIEREEVPATMIIEGDARRLTKVLPRRIQGQVDAIITSPPYPTEHDYTRNARLELVLLGFIEDRDSLRTVKKQMLRSHTKGIYVGDKDSDQVKGINSIEVVANLIDSQAKDGASGFELLYGKVVKEYFGGMKRHFVEAFSVLKPGGNAAYIVGDQASYQGVKIETARLLGEVAESVGFEIESIHLWRQRWSSSTSQFVNENILVLKKPIVTSDG